MAEESDWENEKQSRVNIGEQFQQMAADFVANGASAHDVARIMIAIGLSQLITAYGEDRTVDLLDELLEQCINHCAEYPPTGIVKQGSAS